MSVDVLVLSTAQLESKYGVFDHGSRARVGENETINPIQYAQLRSVLCSQITE